MDAIIEIKSNSPEFQQLIFEMRKVMNKFNRSEKLMTLSEVVSETDSYFTANRKIFVYQFDKRMVGYSVIKIEEDVCWLDWLYVDPDFRGKEVASKLFDHAEEYSAKLGNDQLYVWVHPDNHRMIKFLKKKGYDVLNLVEVKKVKDNFKEKLVILGNEFKY